MEHRPSFSTLPVQYDAFLFAPVCDEANGMHLSVVSVLARMDVDPWDEATRLAAMPKVIAERTLVSILKLVSGSSWKLLEAEAIAARLVRLLPKPGNGAVAVETTAVVAAARGKNYRWVWVLVVLAISYFIAQNSGMNANLGPAKTESSVTAQVKSEAVAPANGAASVPDIKLSR